jgi:predicted RNA binding protein with dsRBD fold (UPF0201 family)
MRVATITLNKFRLAQAWPGLVIILLLSLAACGAADSTERDRSEAQSAAEPAAEERAAPQPTAIYQDGASTVEDVVAGARTQIQEERVIIYTGNMTLVVKDTRQAIKTIIALANEQGGYVSSSNVYQANEVPRGSITIRIPAENYQDTLAQLRDLAVRVESESTSTEDVTQEFTDLQARKTNLEAAEAALRELLDQHQQRGETSDILAVYRELTEVRGRIEQIEGQIRYLANQSALSTITIELIPDVLYQPVSVAGWEPQGVAKEALQALVAALQGLANLVIWLVVLVLPLLIIVLIPLVIVIWLIRWWWKRRQARKNRSKPVTETAPETVET